MIILNINDLVKFMLESIPNYLSVLLMMILAYFLLTSFCTMLIDKIGDVIALWVSILRVDPKDKE
jgi:ABC-type multidrug transport system permease subunit